MTGKARGVTTAPPAPPPPTCRYPIADRVCGSPATHELPVGYASNSDPLPLCTLHAQRFLGGATPL